MVLIYCGGCHPLTRTLTARMTAGAWAEFVETHRSQFFAYFTDDQVKTLVEYFSANFTPDKPVPEIPPEYAAGGAV